MAHIWHNLPRPFFVLAPMYDVTDSAFRQVIAWRGRPDLFVTEFVSADGLMSVGRDKLLREFYVTDIEKPILAQIFGARPEKIEQTAALVKNLGSFVGIDINMGCPEKNVVKQGSCASLIQNPKLAQEIILAAKQGAGDLPVSVKTRIGFNKISELDNWTENLLAANPAAITFHLRTKKEESKVPAHWEIVGRLIELTAESGIKIIANGDIRDLVEARIKTSENNLDGVMLGRAIFGNPWLFAEHTPDKKERLSTLLEHVQIFSDLYLPGPTNDRLFNGHTKNFAVMKKHFKAYVSGFGGAGELRESLMASANPEAVETIIRPLL